MSGNKRGWSDTIPLLPKSSQTLSVASSLSSLEMTSSAGAGAGDPRRTVFLGVDVGTGSARAGLCKKP